MLTVQDFRKLIYTPDLSEIGVQYICTQLPQLPINGDLKQVTNKLHQLISQKAADLAFRRYLDSQEIPYNLSESVSFAEQDYQAMSIGGRRCHVVGGLVTKKNDIRRIRKTSPHLLDEVIELPGAANASEGISAHDLVVFVFIGGLLAKSKDDLRRIKHNELATNIMFVLPEPWRIPKKWYALEQLVIKSDSPEKCKLTIAGEDQQRNQITVDVELMPKVRTVVDVELYSISHIQSHEEITGKIGVHSKVMKQTLVIEPKHWKNIWVYGSDILILGYLLGSVLLEKSIDIPAGESTFQARYGTTEKSTAIRIKQLQPISELIERTRKWDDNRE